MKHIPEIVEQHAEEAAFLWILREGAVRAPHYRLKHLARLEERIEAHLDGLRVAADAGWEAVKAQLKHEEPGEVFAAAAVAFERGDDAGCAAAVEAGTAAPELERGLASALGWLPWEIAEKHARRLLAAPAPARRRAAIAAFAIHGRDPGRALPDAAQDADPRLRARAIEAIGELGLAPHEPLAQRRHADPDPDVRFAAAWTSALLGGDVTPLKKFAETDPKRAERAVRLAARRMDASAAAAWVRTLPPRTAIVGAGSAGDPGLVPWLLEQMRTPALARVAGESFCMITGADIDYEDLDGPAPEGFQAGPTEKPEDEDVEMDPDTDLPWPKPEAVQKWWTAHPVRAGVRHLCGKPMEPAALRQILRDGFQRQRAAAALELALRERGRPLFEVRAPAARQRALLRP